jgi:hypothetical protein
MSSESITDAIDLDNKYSDWGTKNGDYANFYYSDSELLTYESDTGDQHEFISRAPRGAPSYSTCADPIARDYKYFMDMKNAEKNIMFCVKTPKGRYAAVRLLKDWESAEKIQVAIVTWEKH